MPTIFKKVSDRITGSRVWRSFFRHGWPNNPLDRSLIMTTNVFFHLHSVKVSKKSLKAKYSLGLGVITTIAFLSIPYLLAERSGNIAEYRIRLIKKIGLDKVEWLEGPHEPAKYTIDDLKELIVKYKAKCKELS